MTSTSISASSARALNLVVVSPKAFIQNHNSLYLFSKSPSFNPHSPFSPRLTQSLCALSLHSQNVPRKFHQSVVSSASENRAQQFSEQTGNFNSRETFKAKTMNAPEIKTAVSSSTPNSFVQPLKFFDSHTHIDPTMSRMKVSKSQSVSEFLEKTIRIDQLWNVSSSNQDQSDGNVTVGEGHSSLKFEFGGCINVNCWENVDTIQRGLDLQQTTDKVFGTFGLHPHYAKGWTNQYENKMRYALRDPKTVAVGECGLDYYRNLTDKIIQQKVFRKQLEIAVDPSVNLPIVIHSRDAFKDTLKILQEVVPESWPIHLHCYTDAPGPAQEYLETFPNLMIGFTGCITFGSAVDVRESVKIVPLDRLLLETDAPYMAPVPYRGKTCHSGMILATAAKIAEIKGTSLVGVVQQTTLNARKLYRI